MKKHLLLLVVVFTALLCIPVFSFAQESKITVKVNEEVLNFDVEPVIENGRTLVPLRAIFEKLGAKVEWIGETQEIIATKGEKEVKLKISDTNAFIDNQAVAIDTAPKIIDSRTLVPIRFVSESFGADVDWNQETKTIAITHKQEETGSSLATIKLESNKPENMENQMLPDVAYVDVNVSPEQKKKAELQAQINAVKKEIGSTKEGIENLEKQINDGNDGLKSLLEIDKKTLKELEEKRTKLEEELKKYE